MAGGSGANEAKVFDHRSDNAVVGTVTNLQRGIFTVDFAPSGDQVAIAGGRLGYPRDSRSTTTCLRCSLLTPPPILPPLATVTTYCVLGILSALTHPKETPPFASCPLFRNNDSKRLLCVI